MVKEEKRMTIEDDIYFLKKINNKIILNDNYHGISVLDLNFNILKTIFVMNDLLIHNAFVINKREILLNCIDNNFIFIVNIDTNRIRKIEITPEMRKDSIKLVYWSDEKRIILKAYKEHYYEILSNSEDIKRINIDEEWNLSREIVPDYDEWLRNIYIHRQHQYYYDPKYGDCIDSAYVNGTSFYVFEDFIFIKNGCAEERIIPKEKYMFTRMEIIPNGTDYMLVALCDCKSDIIADVIRYRITQI